MNHEEYEEKCDELMGRILRRLVLLSDGKASMAAETQGGAAGKPGHKVLRLLEHDWAWEIRSLRNRYGRARAIDAKRALIAEALTVLVRAKHAPKGRGVKGTKDWREKIARDPRSPSVVAVVFDISRPTVYKYRKEFKVNGSRAA